MSTTPQKSIEELVGQTLNDLHTLSPQDALRTAGLQSEDFWLYDL